jgi:predicted Zn-ribbon and HTH transcriptional regulator
MPNQDEIMLHILKLVGEGAEMALPSPVEAALRTRYYGWIDKKKDNVPTKPKEIWEAREGHAIHGRLREVGRQLKKKHAQLLLSEKEVKICCFEVESTSECPHCPNDPPGA